jgi:hypothetical protein
MPTSPPPISKEAFAERVQRRSRELGLTKAEIGRQTGKTWPTVHAWFTGAQLPENAEALARLAWVLDMSTDELLGIARGQEPTHEAWLAFVETDAGRSMTTNERRELASMAWLSRRPNVLAYHLALNAYRAGDPR